MSSNGFSRCGSAMNRLTGFLGFLVLLSAANGCAPQIVTPTGPHSPTTPDAVYIYQKQPQKYEVLGVVTVPLGGAVRMDDQGDATAGFVELKKQAAALGANGLLLDGDNVQSDVTV